MGPEYHKINSLYKRDERGKFLSEFSCPEFEYLRFNKWFWTEKVDGTNIRLSFEHNGFRGNEHAFVNGRTDNAQIPKQLLDRIIEVARKAPFEDVFPDPTIEVTLYGEGFGAKIQKGGGNYISDGCDFVLFDVLVGSVDGAPPVWLRRSSVEDIAVRLGMLLVPEVGVGNITELEIFVSDGFKSDWGDFPAEGVVATPLVPLFDRMGQRIITKAKTKDYR